MPRLRVVFVLVFVIVIVDGRALLAAHHGAARGKVDDLRTVDSLWLVLAIHLFMRSGARAHCGQRLEVVEGLEDADCAAYVVGHALAGH